MTHKRFYSNHLKKELTRMLVRRFFLQLFVFAAVIMALFGIGYIICSQRVWYWNTPFYELVRSLHHDMAEWFLTMMLAGMLVLTMLNFNRFIHILEYMLEAVETISVGGSSLELPTELREVQLQLDRIQRDANESRREAQEAKKRKEDLIVYMAHDLKTPLTSVIGYLNLLNDESGLSQEQQKKYQGIALRKAERLEELINEFFDITRLNLSHMSMEKSSINLSRMLEQIAYEFRPQFEEKGLRYELSVQPDILLGCDVDKIERVFDNLLRNAFYYSYENSVVRIIAYTTAPDTIHVLFENRGATIPPEKLAHLFDQFYRADAARTSASGGAGLGLAIAKEIVEAHNGSICCTSVEETITFHIQLPQNLQTEENI